MTKHVTVVRRRRTTRRLRLVHVELLDLSCAVNGTGSTDSDGTIICYAWNFGDGNTGTGATTSHTYTRGARIR